MYNMVGNKIVEFRKSSGMSQARLAELLGVSPQAVSKWELGDSLPDIWMISRMAEIFETDINSFISDEKKSKHYQSDQSESNDASHDHEPSTAIRDMSGNTWEDGDFSEIKNLGEKFNFANIKKCLFVGSDLSLMRLRMNNMTECNLTDAKLAGSTIALSNLVRNDFSGADFRNAEFKSSNIKECVFARTDLTNTQMKTSNLENLDLTQANLTKLDIKMGFCNKVIFGGEINGASFSNTIFRKCEFKNATLTDCFFKAVIFRKCTFENCKADKLTLAFLKSNKADTSNIEEIK